MRTSGIVLTVLVVLALVVSVVVAAGPRHGARQATAGGPAMGCQMDMGGCRSKLLTALNLATDQVGDLKTIRDSFMAATKADREQMQAKMKDMAALWAVDSPDAAVIKPLADQIDELRTGIRNAAIDSAIDGLKVLNDKQRQTLLDFMKTCPCACGGACCVVGIDCPMGGCGGPGMGMGAGSGAGMGATCGMGNATGSGAAAGCCSKTK